ncbi:MAG TPA: YetF domain-containing protein [Paracoccaceae bacterium]|nr:YetF domain-containing protein [Paracoccaceae bacterium]
MLDSFYHLIGREADPILWWQMAIRAVIIFLWAILLYRLLPRRAFGSNATVDIVLVVIVGSALSRALTGTAPLLPVIGATALLAVLYTALMLVASRINGFGRIIKGHSIRLIRDGRIDEAAMRRARIGEGDLRESLRLQGVAEIEHVAAAHLERNGDISVVRKG